MGQVLKPLRRCIVVELAQPKFAMEIDGAVDVPHRVSKTRICSLVTSSFPAGLDANNKVEIWFSAHNLAPSIAIWNSAGRNQRKAQQTVSPERRIS
jgi:hypothetical protein